MNPTTALIAGFRTGLEALDEFAAPTGDLAVLDLCEQSGDDDTVLFCTYCYVGSDAALAA